MPSVQQLIDRHIVARGGRETLSAVKTRRLTFRETEANGKTLESVLWTKAPNKELLVESEEGGPELLRTVFDGLDGYAMIRGQRKSLTLTEIAQLRVDSDIFPELRFDLLYPSAKVVGKETWYSRPVYRVDATSTAGYEQRFFFDRESGLIIGKEYPSVPSSHFLEEFEDYLGVKYPRKDQTNTRGKTSTRQLITIEHNLNIDDALFSVR
jgi:hypothetical protein